MTKSVYQYKCEQQYGDIWPTENSNRVIHDQRYSNMWTHKQVRILSEGYMTKLGYQHGVIWAN